MNGDKFVDKYRMIEMVKVFEVADICIFVEKPKELR